jgi:NADPH:quinone reductase-like Zn-dependent oxidoreductase
VKAAVVREPGKAPVFADFTDPTAAAGEHFVKVAASALCPLARARASGAHYSASSQLPAVAGVDGVGHLQDGSRVYFLLPRAPYGGMAESTVVPASQCVALPDHVDDEFAAAIANPGMSSWAALTERARFKAGGTVLVNGATGASGRLAISIAKHLGAKKVIATGRNQDVLGTLAELGADATISLLDDGQALKEQFEHHFAHGVDVVLDYLWGESAGQILAAGAKAGANIAPIRFVQIGTAGGADISLPGALLRSSTIELLGSGLGSVALPRLLAIVGALMEATASADFTIPIRTVPLAEVEQGWLEQGPDRLVFSARG